MGNRKTIPKRLRFEVFKRDGFACQYCGAHPPLAILELDHINPVALGGGDDEDNLITACFNCNRGKSSIPLSVAPKSLAEKAAEITEREDQLRGYTEAAQARRERREQQVWQVFHYWRNQTKTTHARFNSVAKFVDHLGVNEVIDAVQIAMGQSLGDNAEFRYFCGICWNKIKGDAR